MISGFLQIGAPISGLEDRRLGWIVCFEAFGDCVVSSEALSRKSPVLLSVPRDGVRRACENERGYFDISDGDDEVHESRSGWCFVGLCRAFGDKVEMMDDVPMQYRIVWPSASSKGET